MGSEMCIRDRLITVQSSKRKACDFYSTVRIYIADAAMRAVTQVTEDGNKEFVKEKSKKEVKKELKKYYLLLMKFYARVLFPT